MIYRNLRLVEKHAMYPVALTCAYEALAIILRHKRVPTISQLANRHKVLFGVAVGALVAHVIFYEGGE